MSDHKVSAARLREPGQNINNKGVLQKTVNIQIITLTKSLRSKRQLSLRLPIYIINPVDKIKSSYLKLFHARSTADNRISQAIMFLIIL